jgi:hypothetical protein
MCPAVASMPLQLSRKHSWLPLMRIAAWPVAPGAPGPGTSTSPVIEADNVVHPSPAAAPDPLPPACVAESDPEPPDPLP